VVKDENFPMEAVKRVSKMVCNCQLTYDDFLENRHKGDCYVGRAQAYLGCKVTIKPSYGGENAKH